jgi:hypothetical protein
MNERIHLGWMSIARNQVRNKVQVAAEMEL